MTPCSSSHQNGSSWTLKKYLGPETDCASWFKAYGCTETKYWFPYEWFDYPDKFDYPSLSSYECWWSKLKARYLLSRQEWVECKTRFQERGFDTMADWLRYYIKP